MSNSTVTLLNNSNDTITTAVIGDSTGVPVYDFDISNFTIQINSSSKNPTINQKVTVPWNIGFVNLTADFAVNTTDELVLTYDVGKDRDYKTLIYQKDCENNITDINITSTSYKTTKNSTHELLTLNLNFNKSNIAQSII